MIIISSGFPKSASTLLFLYTESLINSSGRSKGQKLFRKHNSEGFTPHFGLLNTTWYVIASMFGPLVIKTHAGPTFFVRMLIGMGLAKAYYSIRDPRDAMLSAMDHGNKARTNGIRTDSDAAFAPFKEWKDIYPALHLHYERYKAWKKYGKVIFPRYELLVENPKPELKKIIAHIGILSMEKHIDSTIETLQKQKNTTKNFNKGEISRYRNELNEQQVAELEKELRDCIVSMDYKLHNA